MKIRTNELIDTALDWAVATCSNKGVDFEDPNDPWLTVDGIADQPLHSFTPSTDWAHGGPIIEREKINVEVLKEGDGWCATIGCTPHDFLMWDQPYSGDASYGEGPTPLIAAMRAFVASHLGDKVEIPEELL